MKTYTEVKKEVDSMADNLGMPVDSGIKKIVVGLRMHEFPTTGSCEGHMDWGTAYPWVEIYAPDQSEAAWIAANKAEHHRLSKLLRDFYTASGTDPLFAFDDIGIFGGFRFIPKGCPLPSPNELSLEEQRKDFDAFADYLISLGHN